MEEGPGFDGRGRAAAEEAAALLQLGGRRGAPEGEPVGSGNTPIVAAFKRHGVRGGLAGLLDDKGMVEEEESLGRDGADVALADRGIDIAEVEGLEELEPLVAE